MLLPMSRADFHSARARAAVALAVALAVAGCGLGMPGEGEGEGGLGLPQQLPGETYPGERRQITGQLEITDVGCLHVVVDGESHFVIWPGGAELADAVRLPSGEELRPGDTVLGTGALTPVAPLTAEGDGYWAHAIGFCAPEADRVLVFDDLRGAKDRR